jgi:hypothetical protein
MQNDNGVAVSVLDEALRCVGVPPELVGVVDVLVEKGFQEGLREVVLFLLQISSVYVQVQPEERLFDKLFRRDFRLKHLPEWIRC